MFEKFNFTNQQIKKYYKAALKDFKIAAQSDIPEVAFKFSYDALLKLAITICARNGLRVKSRQGHHIELINKLANLLQNVDIKVIGDDMRSKRNWDLYNGGILITEKETVDYISWLRKIFQQADDFLHKDSKLF